MISAVVLSLLVASASCATGVVPTFPGPGQAFKEGGDCPISWNLDTTGKWTNFSVDLMSGSNFAMQTVSNVFKDRDGTKGETTYTWKCPTVTPTSAIYFYQFTQAGADTTWTTRFAITSPSGESTPPANQTQPGGAQIPWGVGHLAGAGAEPAPASPATTAPSATANITALNTPSPATANATNSTTGALAGANNTSSVTGTPAATSPGSTSSGSSSSGSYSKNPASASPSNSRPTNPSSNTTSTPSAGAHTVTVCQNVAAVLTLAAVLIVS
ncbi:hypothetical protein PGTUg99_024291 [Puccinia graminis f. sp. tritici]|uniref:Ser-Thr-rich glycosyl-phosphatidyl-inositol-anchored membrane family-domain-containing protein n=2 Tax=Puccinia graminis f. sp. tritici TaxID=56615 RepID=E3LBB0_PUCGT|nr:uncharacterized protein PGTG_19870 [Puccinia graminis f. sp. tritici CRL 75-36-700-3]EFP93835.1 hypothetical protein PGTG_19870 [Puccinia graminis f. sp. tritici CRL 75-36-700-3]KAA1072878.1 hypothetical protein PGTUg99_024291 [Puccinia graminis f. sp. tritici]